ncbi:curli-like amyloid fiber formation chaperone CsgH [Pseudomonas japonica]|uniref:curli-like amyloid fiber formation chaperone CsgH n=1 Tax=Pseudomonas japonica TaxID=256466 RepID=UPI0015E31F21|nr:curli-like amyloid fiber formation chaperone CsgH [Pseudomonas japonica]MBA1241663.1 hypothetical protein [Pseudomonas japonica]MBA1291184.1 hypothetical protein [Pseudomonas japonica]
MIDFSQLAVFIDTQRDGAAMVISPHIESPTPLNLRYRMTVSQQSAGGTSNVNQQGEIETGVVPSSVRLSLPAGATCTVHLEVLQGDVMVKALDQRCDL